MKQPGQRACGKLLQLVALVGEQRLHRADNGGGGRPAGDFTRGHPLPLQPGPRSRSWLRWLDDKGTGILGLDPYFRLSRLFNGFVGPDGCGARTWPLRLAAGC